MRTSNRRLQRTALAPLCAVLMLTGCRSDGSGDTGLTLYSATVDSAGVAHIAGYQVPPLAGWKRETKHKATDPAQNVRFTRVVAGVQLLSEFALLQRRPDSAPDTAADLAQKIQSIQSANKVNDPQRGIMRQILLSQATQFQGHPACVWHQVLRSAAGVTEIKVMNVADGKNTFCLFQSSVGRGREIPLAAKTAANQAWQVMTTRFKGCSSTCSLSCASVRLLSAMAARHGSLAASTCSPGVLQVLVPVAQRPSFLNGSRAFD